jgi:hypothetical protein
MWPMFCAHFASLAKPCIEFAVVLTASAGAPRTFTPFRLTLERPAATGLSLAYRGNCARANGCIIANVSPCHGRHADISFTGGAERLPVAAASRVCHHIIPVGRCRLRYAYDRNRGTGIQTSFDHLFEVQCASLASWLRTSGNRVARSLNGLFRRRR